MLEWNHPVSHLPIIYEYYFRYFSFSVLSAKTNKKRSGGGKLKRGMQLILIANCVVLSNDLRYEER